MREILASSYAHLALLYVLVVLLLQANWLISSDLNLLLFAVVLGALGLALKGKRKQLGLPSWLVFVAFGVAVLLRAIPYFFTSVPLGYDPGLHVYAAESPFGGEWLKGAYPLPFVLFSWASNLLFGSDFHVTWLFVFLSAATVFAVYFALNRLFDRDTAVVGALLFLVSIAQYQTFWYNYYKNVFGIISLLVALVYLPTMGRLNWQLILFGTLVAISHNAALFIFGLSYIAYIIVHGRNWTYLRASLLNGAAIVILFFLLNFDRVREYILPQLYWSARGVIEGGGAGTFFDASAYLLYMLPFIPFAISGLLVNWRKYELSIPALISLLVVVFGLFFHNRFIIYLDVFVILFGAVGVVSLIRARPRYGTAVVAVLFVASLTVTALHAYDSAPLISDEEFARIQTFDSILPADATLVSTDKYYSPWLKGYVHRDLIAPGLFEPGKTEEEWISFVSGDRTTFLNDKPRPLYVFVGEEQPQYDFSDSCFEARDTGLYEYVCT